MPRVSPHLVKSAIRLVRQSTTVPNTSNTSAFTAEISDMVASPSQFVIPGWAEGPDPESRDSGFASSTRPGMTPSIQVEFFQLPVIGLDVAHGPGDRAHHHGLGLDHVLAELDAREQRTVGDAGGGEQAVASHNVFDAVDHARIGDPHLAGALALLFGVEYQPALHLAADAAQRRRRQHAFGRAAGADIHIDPGIVRVGAMEDARDGALGDWAGL